MDRKSILVLAACGALFLLWIGLTPRLYPPRPVVRTNTFGSTGSNALPSTPSTPLEAAVPGAPIAPPRPEVPEEILVITNQYARYTFTSHGGGLKQVELLRYPESVGCGRRAKTNTTRLASLNAAAQQPVCAMLGGPEVTGDGLFRLERYTRTNGPGFLIEGVRAQKTLTNGLQLVTEFEPATNYLVNVRTRLENRSGQSMALPPQQYVVGAATPLTPQDDESLVGIHWFDGDGSTEINRAYFDNKTLGCLPGTPRSLYSVTGRPIVWAAAHNQFFFLALLPTVPGTELSATRFTLPPPSRDEIAADNRTITNQFAFQVNLHYGATNLAAGGTLSREFLIFAGPKELRTLEHITADLKNQFDRIMGYTGFFGFFSKVLLLSMNKLNSLGLSYAASIIAITVIIKLLFWPLTAVSTRASKRMQALQPQMKAIQEKYRDDPVKMNRKVMEFMKEHKVSPMSGCWPVLLQFPVLIGFFKMVQSAIELRGASFLWACDLSKSDTIFVVPGLNFNVNPLPLMMGGTMLWQAHLMPPSPGMDPMQQKIMKYFPMIFLVVLYNYSAGLTLYWTVQNLLSIAQMKLTRAADEKKATSPAAAPVRPVAVLPPKKKK